jgi:hypothetical protein
MENMDVVTFILLSIVAPLLVQLIKVLTSKVGWEMDKPVITIVVAVISAGAAFILDAPNLPEYTDPMVFIQEMLTIAGSVFATATVLYNMLLDKVFDLLGFVQKSHK